MSALSIFNPTSIDLGEGYEFILGFQWKDRADYFLSKLQPWGGIMHAILRPRFWICEGNILINTSFNQFGQ